MPVGKRHGGGLGGENRGEIHSPGIRFVVDLEQEYAARSADFNGTALTAATRSG